jgi:hypothetical protein
MYDAPPTNYAQTIEFKGLTCKIFRNKDLSSIFSLNSRFGPVWERISASSPGVALTR